MYLLACVFCSYFTTVSFSFLLNIGLVCYFLFLPICKHGIVDFAFYESQINPISRIIIQKIISFREKKISKKWLHEIEYISKESMPVIEWVEDEHRSLGIDSFYCLDEYSDDCRQLLQRSSHNVVRDDKIWFESKFTNCYYFEPQYSPKPRYKMTKEIQNLRIQTDSQIDHWIYLVSKRKCPVVYALDFFLTLHTEMQETLQVDFACHSLAKRFRFNLVNNKMLHFDIVDYGCFTYWQNKSKWDMFKTECTLPLHKPIHVRVEIINNFFAIYFDEEMKMAINLKEYVPQEADWYIIFWNGIIDQSMDIEISNFKIFKEAKNGN